MWREQKKGGRERETASIHQDKSQECRTGVVRVRVSYMLL